MVKLKRWSKEELLKLSEKELLALHQRRQELAGTPEADEALNLIEEIGVPQACQGLRLDPPFGKKMQEAIFSAQGKVAAMEAARRGDAPMAAIDPLLQQGLGKQYGATYEATVQAGCLVGSLMRQNQWETNGERQRLPVSCVAKTAALFVYIPSKKS